jgi:hypothetical protein
VIIGILNQPVGSTPTTSSCTININSVCPANNTVVEPPGEVDPPADPLCVSASNTLVQKHVYEFSQTYPMGGCEDESFYIMSPAVNANNTKVDRYFSMQGDDFSKGFAQGTAGVRKPAKAGSVQNYLNYWFRNDLVANSTTLGGGQLVDVDGHCIAYSLDPASTEDAPFNYVDQYGAKSLRIQVETCVDAEGFDSTDPAQLHKAKQQLWSVELSPFSHELAYIRNVCTNKVIKRVQGGDGRVYPGMACGEPHFVHQLVDMKECVDDHKFGVNECLFKVGDLGLHE